MKKVITATICTFLFFCSNAIYAQQVKCFWCSGSGRVEDWVDPSECQNCVNWNASYRSKVACNVCKDTRLTPNRRYRMITCSSCKGTGRNYDQERRNEEFAGRNYMLSSSSIVNVNGLDVHEGYWSSRISSYLRDMTYREAEENCQSMGDGWRLPSFSELNLLFKAQKNGYNLGFNGATYYWTTTTNVKYNDDRLRYVLAKETDQWSATFKSIGNSNGQFAGTASCKCVKSY